MRKVFGVILVTLAIGAVGSRAQEVLTNEGIVKMHRAGLPSAVIVAKIQASRTAFDTSVDALVALAGANVPDTVIAEMTASAEAPRPPAPAQPVIHTGQIVVGQKATPTPNAPATFSDPRCPGPGIFALLEDGTLKQLDPSAYAGAKTNGLLKSAFTYGILSVKSKAMIQGTTSHNRLYSRSPTFYFCFEETQTGLSFETSGATTPSQFLLVSLEVNAKQNARMLVTGKANRYTGGYAGPPSKARVDFTYRKIAAGVYEVSANGLGPGEYCFFYTGSVSATGATTYGLVTPSGGGKVFDFSVG